MNEPQRRLPVGGAVNVRDLGGYLSRDGRQTRWGVFLRSDNLDRLTPADQRLLLDYGLRRIVDLRTARELDDNPDVFAQSSEVSYHHLPLIEDGPDMESLGAMQTHAEVYPLFLDRCQPAIKNILETICTAEAGCTLYHCTGGKDRTGVITALLLGLVDVDDEIIAQDYALTEQYLAPRIAEWRQQVQESGGDVERYDRLSATPPQSMRHTLNHLKSEYGGVHDYVKAIGVDESAIEMLRHRFVGEEA